MTKANERNGKGEKRKKWRMFTSLTDRAMDPAVYESDMRAKLLSSDMGGKEGDVLSPMNFSHMR